MSTDLSEDDPILTTSAVARRLGISIGTVQMLMETGVIRSWKTPGGHRRTRTSFVPSDITCTRGRTVDTKLEQNGLLCASAIPSPPVTANPVDLAADERFDRITRLATIVTHSPIALLGLLTKTHLHIKARVGVQIQQTKREWTFCTYAVEGESPFVVQDTMSDVRFRNIPLVLAEPYVRFYAGIPIFSHGQLPVGTLCVMDLQPRRLRAAELRALIDLAEMASLELRQNAA